MLNSVGAVNLTAVPACPATFPVMLPNTVTGLDSSPMLAVYIDTYFKSDSW
jgi:hypothetical protein